MRLMLSRKMKSVALPFVWTKATKKLLEKQNVFYKSGILFVEVGFQAIYMQGIFCALAQIPYLGYVIKLIYIGGEY